jgi:hypothetical protein
VDRLARHPELNCHLDHRQPVSDYRHHGLESLFHDAALDEHPPHPLAQNPQREEETTARLSSISRNSRQASAGTVQSISRTQNDKAQAKPHIFLVRPQGLEP